MYKQYLKKYSSIVLRIMKKTILHLLISLFLVQFLVAFNLTALELPVPRDRVATISTFQLLNLNCVFTESSGKSDSFVGDRTSCFFGNREYSGNPFDQSAFIRSLSIRRSFYSSYEEICNLRM